MNMSYRQACALFCDLKQSGCDVYLMPAATGYALTIWFNPLSPNDAAYTIVKW